MGWTIFFLIVMLLAGFFCGILFAFAVLGAKSDDDIEPIDMGYLELEDDEFWDELEAEFESEMEELDREMDELSLELDCEFATVFPDDTDMSTTDFSIVVEMDMPDLTPPEFDEEAELEKWYEELAESYNEEDEELRVFGKIT